MPYRNTRPRLETNLQETTIELAREAGAIEPLAELIEKTLGFLRSRWEEA